jgi:hypothetical protein
MRTRNLIPRRSMSQSRVMTALPSPPFPLAKTAACICVQRGNGVKSNNLSTKKGGSTYNKGIIILP